MVRVLEGSGSSTATSCDHKFFTSSDLVLVHSRDNYLRAYRVVVKISVLGLKTSAHCLKFGQPPLSLTVPVVVSGSRFVE